MSDGLREAVERLAEASLRDGRGGTWVHDGWFATLLTEHPATPAEEDMTGPEQMAARALAEEGAEVAVEEREALFEVIRINAPMTTCCGTLGLVHRITDAVLASDWLRDHDAALTAKARAEAPREAADALNEEGAA